MPFRKHIQLTPISQNYVDGLNDGTNMEYKSRLSKFERYCKQKHGSIESVMEQIKMEKINTYDLLIDFKNSLKLFRNRMGKPMGIAYMKSVINTIVNFIEIATDLEISRNRLNKKLHLGKPEESDEFAPDREIAFKILANCADKRLKAYLHLLAAVGPRPKQEALSLRIKDLVFDSPNPYIHFSKEITKTGKERNPFMTVELIEALKVWVAHKYRTRNKITIAQDGKSRTEKHTPNKDGKDLLFSIHKRSSALSIYNQLLIKFHKLLNDLNLDKRRDDGRHLITLKSFRTLVKGQISDEGQEQYSEYHIGHKNSPYWKRSENDRFKVFKKIEHAITFLDQDAVALATNDLRSQSEAQKQEIIKLKKQAAEAEDRNNKFVEQAREYMIRKDKEMAERLEELDRRMKKLVILSKRNSKMDE